MSEDNQNTINIPIYSLISQEIEGTGQNVPLFTPAETALLLLAAVTTDGYGELPIGFLLEKGAALLKKDVSEVAGRYHIRGYHYVTAYAGWLANIYFDGVDDVNAQARGILELRLLAAAYEIFGDSRLAPLLKGDFATPAERLADIESKGVWISGRGTHQEGEEAAANLKVRRSESGEFLGYELSPVNATCATQAIKWTEDATDSKDPPDIIFKNKVKNLAISDLYADKLSVRFCHDLSDSGFYATDLAELVFQNDSDSNPIVLSNIELDDTNFGKLDIGTGTTLINCDFNAVKVDRLAQNSLIYGNEYGVGNAVITKFQDCTLRHYRAPHSALNDKEDMPLFSYNWEFTGGEINAVVLPRSPQTQKYVFNQSTVADLVFAPPDEADDPAGRLDVHLNGGSIRDARWSIIHAPPLKYRNSDTAPSEYATISFTADRERFVVPAPRGHWDEINLLRTSFSAILEPKDDSTCSSLVISELKVGEASTDKAASGALDVVWKQYFSGDTTKVDIIDDLPRIDPCSRATKDKYLLALLGLVITPDNIDAIHRVSQVTAPVAVNTKTTDKTKKVAL